MSNHRAMSPMEAITQAMGDIITHESLVQDAFGIINPLLQPLMEVVPDLYEVGDARMAIATLPRITQAALIEVVLHYRKQGWTVGYSRNDSNVPVVTLCIPRGLQ